MEQRVWSGRGKQRAAVLLALVGLAGALPATADAAGPPLGKYSCLYPPFGTVHPLKLLSTSKYKIDKSRKSKYKYAKGSKKIVFRKGAYADFYGRYERGAKQIVIYDKETDARLWNCPKGSL